MVYARMLSAASLIGLVTVPGCLQETPDVDGSVPGDPIGIYRVDATLVESSCGAGAAEAPDTWKFEVKLSRSKRKLYWNNGRESIEGKIADDGVTFDFDTAVAAEVRETKPGRPGCTLWRRDQVHGTLAPAKDDEVAGFDGALAYTFAAGENSQCAEDVTELGLSQLPCTITYRLRAVRLPK
ncbi:MAG: hypothetical protein MUF54_13200 [Polyangiaceae bacterium]|jgi:hypothetical protein|nr:hypothetical protein [Polyangiaceae bacterium]